MTKHQPATVVRSPEHSTQYVIAWLSQSRTHKHIQYVVRFDILENAFSCECPGYTYRGRCGHLDAAMAALVATWRAKKGAVAA